MNKIVCAAVAGGFSLLLLTVGASGNELSEFKMKSCGNSKCIAVESGRAWQSKANGSFAFAEARLTIFDKQTGVPERVIEARDVFYDVVIEKILLRRPVKGIRGESYYDLKREELVTLALAMQ